MTDLLSIGKSGLMAYARSLETVSHNIANAENPDYVRRSTLLSDATVTSGLNPLYAAQSGLNGVRVASTARASDEFIEAQVRLSGASRVRTETLVNWLDLVETGLDGAGTNVGTTLNDFYSGGEELAAAPFDSALRLTFLSNLESTADAFRRTSSNLQLTLDQIGQSGQSETLQLNGALENLAKINLDIVRTPMGSDAYAGLLDSRDSALAVITEKLDVKVSLAGSGVANLSFDGIPVVTNGTAATIGVTTNPDASFMITVDGATTRAPINGTLAGLSRASAVTSQRFDELNVMAQKFVDDVNAWHSAGVTDGGASGAPLLTMTGDASTIAVTTQNIADLAVASSDGTPNGNLLALSSYRGAGGSEAAWNDYMSLHANTLATARNEKAAAAALDTNARTTRDQLSRVNLDREAADLIRLQQAYEASARVIQIARETVESVLAIF